MKRIVAIIAAALPFLGVVAAALLAPGCGGGSLPSGAVATVGDASISMSQLQGLLNQATAQLHSQGTSAAKGSATYDRLEATIIDYLVQVQVVDQSASELGVFVSDKEVADQIAQIEAATSGGEQRVLSLLRHQGMTMALLRRSIKEQLLTQRVLAKVVATAGASEAQIRAYWQAHGAALRKQKKTASFARAKAVVRQTLLTQARRKLWTAWLSQRTSELGVKYAAGYEPAKLTASPTPSAAASSRG